MAELRMERTGPTPSVLERVNLGIPDISSRRDVLLSEGTQRAKNGSFFDR